MPVKKLVASDARKATPVAAAKKRAHSASKTAKPASVASQRREALRMLADIEVRARESLERAKRVLERLS